LPSVPSSKLSAWPEMIAAEDRGARAVTASTNTAAAAKHLL
jgi:hypothetical protein